MSAAAARGWLAALLLAGSLLPAQPLQASETRDTVAEIVRLMGYGAGIHNFKNYILRGAHREKYGSEAAGQFGRALELVKGLERQASLGAAEREALAGIRRVLEAYLAGLTRIKELFEKGWRLEDIDRVVIVDDTPAVEGLKRLRAGHQWNPLEQIEYELGYGGGIHNFKNYVLRGTEADYTAALTNLLAVESLIAQMLSEPAGREPGRAQDLADLERVTHAYVEYLPLVERLIRMQRPIVQIDLAVKVNDEPAKTALARLRGSR